MFRGAHKAYMKMHWLGLNRAAVYCGMQALQGIAG